MNRVLIDTNIVLDLLAQRDGFYQEAAEIFSLADKHQIALTISSLTFANTNYILTKLTSANEAREILRKFKVLVEVLNLNDRVVDLTLSDNKFPDFEDGFQYYSALENDVEIIITRNKKDFKHSNIPVLSPKEYLAQIH
ncbi:type II toxin-antitoxin system VapC family toxin [Luteibaculum oceani]|uniref:PIN domain-containing protein n=1 Tax=Luteibaculum oceani TaxID=1294296 RepID=A0A5C6VA28_9FLAO|nr:PIN domain-containing protein [Luteibaculum oceani]TXC82087.1 PIN domain-containing protein [Luteibaculum oceani]